MFLRACVSHEMFVVKLDPTALFTPKVIPLKHTEVIYALAAWDNIYIFT